MIIIAHAGGAEPNNEVKSEHRPSEMEVVFTVTGTDHKTSKRTKIYFEPVTPFKF